tara:strand:+ start:1608 stop:2471 length:864 start_codon:yes stop_codon:yes gene_type:complete
MYADESSGLHSINKIGDRISISSMVPVDHPLTAPLKKEQLRTILYKQGLPKESIIETVSILRSDKTIIDGKPHLPIHWAVRVLTTGDYQIQDPFNTKRKVLVSLLNRSAVQTGKANSVPFIITTLPSRKSVIYLGFWAAFSLIASVLITKKGRLYLSSFSKNKDGRSRQTPKLQVSYLKELDALRRKKWIKQGHDRFFFRELGALLRRFYAEEFNVLLMQKESEAVIRTLRERQVPENTLTLLKSVLDTCDQKDVEGALPPQDCFKRAVSLVSKNGVRIPNVQRRPV